MRQQPHSLEYFLFDFARMHHICMRREFEQRGLGDVANSPILFLLAQEREQPLTQRQLAQRLNVSPPTVAMSIKRLQRAGLVCKQSDQADLRKNHIALTEAGREYTARMVEAERSVYQYIIEGFQEDEIEAMCGYYMRMIDNMFRHGCHRPNLFQPETDEKE